jgi:two-component system sensor histidine kinase FlrB
MRQQDDPVSATELKSAFQCLEDTSASLEDAFRQLCSGVDRLNATADGASNATTARLKRILEVLPAGVVVLDGDGCVIESNPQAEQLLGGALTGRQWRDVAAQSFAPRWDDGHDVSLTSGRRVNVSTQAISGEPGQIVLLSDVTETRRLQDQLARRGQFSAKGEMAAALAHQMRTPLASAMLYASNLGNPSLDEQKRERFIDRLTERLRHMESLIEDMLVLARTSRLQTAAVSLTELWESFKAQVDVDFSDQSFHLHWCGTMPDLTLAGNRSALLSVMSNLVANAKQLCEGKGSLTVSIEQPNDQILSLCFEDDGPGIGDQDLETVFEPFYSTRNSGTGLGLAIARAVILAHGGNLRAEACDHGARFVLSLPVDRAVRQPSKESTVTLEQRKVG